MRHGQLAIEFVIMMGIAVIIGVLFLASANELFGRVSEEQRIESLNDVGYTIQDEVILALTVEDGYMRSFTIPQTADRFAYTINSTATGVTLTSGPVTITYPIPPVTGQFHKGINTIEKSGTVTVT
jgi:hypothetical protein